MKQKVLVVLLVLAVPFLMAAACQTSLAPATPTPAPLGTPTSTALLPTPTLAPVEEQCGPFPYTEEVSATCLDNGEWLMLVSPRIAGTEDLNTCFNRGGSPIREEDGVVVCDEPVSAEAPAPRTGIARPKESTGVVSPVTLTQTVTTTIVAGDPACQPRTYEVYDAAAEWDVDNLDLETPTGDDFLAAHDLTMAQVQYFVYPDDKDKDTKATWDPGLYVFELDEDEYGQVTVPLLEGYAYTVALCDGSVQTFWGGDPNVREVTLLWGLSARWVPSYVHNKAGSWLSLEDPEEWVTRENRFGRYRRSPESGLPNLPYFDRWGPYNTLPGNVMEWNPPSLDAISPQTYLEAAAMLGGLARESEWSRTDDGGWVWRYGQKVAGSGTYCPPGDPCWQTVYVPPASRGCAILWMEAPKEVSGGQRATTGGPYPFYAGDLAILLDGDHQVDEFSYHPVSCSLDPTR